MRRETLSLKSYLNLITHIRELCVPLVLYMLITEIDIKLNLLRKEWINASPGYKKLIEANAKILKKLKQDEIEKEMLQNSAKI